MIQHEMDVLRSRHTRARSEISTVVIDDHDARPALDQNVDHGPADLYRRDIQRRCRQPIGDHAALTIARVDGLLADNHDDF